VLLLKAMREAGYDVGDFPEDGDELVHTLIAAGGHDVEWLTEDQLKAAVARVPLADYTRWFDALPASLRDGMLEHWGPPPGSLYVDGTGEGCHRAGRAAVRQRRADDPAAARLRREPDRDLPRPRPAAEPPLPRRLPLARRSAEQRRLRCGRRRPPRQARHARVAARQGLGPVAGCAPDAVLGDLPLFYPFIVNDPGRARRPSAAATRPSSTTSCRRWPRRELRRDGAARAAARRVRPGAGDGPGKLPTIRGQIWELITPRSCTTTCT
jgi:cobaltochelatase CobN